MSFDHYLFRTKAGSPDTLVVAACGYVFASPSDAEHYKREACGPGSYLIDTVHDYAVSRASADDWNRANYVAGSRHWGDGNTAPHPLFFISGVTSLGGGRFRFHGIDYGKPEKWFINPVLEHTLDSRLAFLRGIDERRLPSGALIVGDRIGGGLYGNHMVDFFEASKGRRLASLRMDCGMATAHCVEDVIVVNSRWVAFTLATDLSEALLFDFGPELPSEEK